MSLQDHVTPGYALRVRGACKTFGAHLALDHVDFDVKRGEIHCLAGENGSGKSTLIKLISGAYSADAGTSFVFGDDASPVELSPIEARRQGVRVIWQDLALFPALSVAENIGFDRFVSKPLLRRDGRAMREAAKVVLARLGADLDPDRLVSDLTIAERQIVSICRAVIGDPRIVFMDEPTASLTQLETDGLIAIVRAMAAQGISVVFVSHRLAEVLDISERVTVLKDGKLVGCFSTEGMTQRRLGELMTGSDLTPSILRTRPLDEVVLRTSGLSRAGEYQGIDLEIRRGEVIGLIGLLGAGRTELAHTLFGMTRPDAGSIEVAGLPVRLNSNRDAIARGVAYVSEDRLSLGLDQKQSIIDNTIVTVMRSLERFGLLLPSAKRRLTQDWIDRLKTKAANISLPVSSLSGGNQQRVVLAKWLAINPRLLILDAPTVGVDVGARASIFEIVRTLAEEGMAILLISDETGEVYHNAHRIAVMKNGHIQTWFDPELVHRKRAGELRQCLSGFPACCGRSRARS